MKWKCYITIISSLNYYVTWLKVVSHFNFFWVWFALISWMQKRIFSIDISNIILGFFLRNCNLIISFIINNLNYSHTTSLSQKPPSFLQRYKLWFDALQIIPYSCKILSSLMHQLILACISLPRVCKLLMCLFHGVTF